VTVSTVRYDAHFGFLGFYICRPEHRGEGLGLRLFETALAGVDVTTIGLDGVVEQERNYARSGFVTAYRSVRFGGRPDVSSFPHSRVRQLGREHVDQLIAYERGARVFPAPRRRFLERWLAAPGTFGFAVGHDSPIDGYGVIRRCRSGHKIGPLFCDDARDAGALLGALDGAVDGSSEIFVDVPEPNTDAMRTARGIGLSPRFEAVRMYRGPAPEIALEKVFGVTTFELG
jgi:hypothetical protein